MYVVSQERMPTFLDRTIEHPSPFKVTPVIQGPIVTYRMDCNDKKVRVLLDDGVKGPGGSFHRATGEKI